MCAVFLWYLPYAASSYFFIFLSFRWDCFLQISLTLTLSLFYQNSICQVFFQTLLFSYNQTSIYSFIHSYRYLSVPCEIRGCFKTGFEIDVYGSYHVHFFPACKHSHINISFTLHKGYYYSCFLSPWETEDKKVAVIYSRTWRVSSRICTISYSPGTSTLSHPNTRLTWT